MSEISPVRLAVGYENDSETYNYWFTRNWQAVKLTGLSVVANLLSDQRKAELFDLWRLEENDLRDKSRVAEDWKR